MLIAAVLLTGCAAEHDYGRGVELRTAVEQACDWAAEQPSVECAGAILELCTADAAHWGRFADGCHAYR